MTARKRSDTSPKGLIAAWGDMQAAMAHDLPGAIDQAIELLDDLDVDDQTSHVHRIGRVALGALVQRCLETPRAPENFLQLLRKSVALGTDHHAYYLAGQLLERGPNSNDYEEAKRCYEIAMHADGLIFQVASRINYGSLLADGHLQGSPDLHKAYELYAQAAELGLAFGAFKAGTTAAWLAYQGETAYAEGALKWLQHALDAHQLGHTELDRIAAPQFPQTLDYCRLELAALAIHGLNPRADLEEAYALLGALASAGNEIALERLGTASEARLRRLEPEPDSTPGDHWRKVLAALGWKLEPQTERLLLTRPNGRVLPVEGLRARCGARASGALPVYVAHDAAPPFLDSGRLLSHVRSQLLERDTAHSEGFLLLQSKALFLEKKERIYTVALLVTPDSTDITSLGLATCSPDMLCVQARKRVAIGSDPVSGSRSHVLPFAVNRLDEGLPVQGYDDRPVNWVSFETSLGTFCLPFVDEGKLPLLDTGPDSLPRTRQS